MNFRQEDTTCFFQHHLTSSLPSPNGSDSASQNMTSTVEPHTEGSHFLSDWIGSLRGFSM